MNEEIEKEVKEIAEYLGANTEEMWFEMKKVLLKVKEATYQEGRREVEEMIAQTLNGESVRNGLATLIEKTENNEKDK